MSKIILAIESSCDDTSAAIMKDAKLLSLGVSSQKIHEKHGGVVPELASRAHLQSIVPIINHVIEEANIHKSDINCVAFTQGPGLLGSLLVGTSFAKSFAMARNLPMVAVNHMEAHVLAHFIEEPRPMFPFLCLTVSGGHTQIVLVKSPLEMQIIGQTLDDAAGEAFDKTGKMLGLPYPAGPVIDKLAALGSPIYQFTHPSVDGYNYSFSGLKTGIRNFLAREVKANPDFIKQEINNICASVQKTIIDILLNQFEKAAQEMKITQIGIAGGVSANSGLRKAVSELATTNNWTSFIPKFEYCTDNAGMIAMAAHYKLEAGIFVNQLIKPEPRLKF